MLAFTAALFMKREDIELFVPLVFNHLEITNWELSDVEFYAENAIQTAGKCILFCHFFFLNLVIIEPKQWQ